MATYTTSLLASLAADNQKVLQQLADDGGLSFNVQRQLTAEQVTEALIELTDRVQDLESRIEALE